MHQPMRAALIPLTQVLEALKAGALGHLRRGAIGDRPDFGEQAAAVSEAMERAFSS